MAYRLKCDEVPAAGLRRMAREQLQGALREITGANRAGVSAAVHATRKHIKKVRALLRLVRNELGEEVFKEENRRLRDVARSFSNSRDACVRMELLGKLRGLIGDDGADFAQTRAVLEKQLEVYGGDLTPERREAEANLLGMCDRIEGWPLDELKMEDLCCALRKTYRRGRKCFGYALSDPKPEDFHSLRKRVKELWYQVRILQQLNRLVLCEVVNEAKTLAQHLGDLHDISSFYEWLARAHDLPEAEGAILHGLICTRERESEKIALDLGARFFAEKPGVFERRLLRYAREWPATQSASA
ncbi:MAG TPA: CHAD domain-containing protein [Chthoniobacterales bacterium]|jgi:CHAD domain-containing protein